MCLIPIITLEFSRRISIKSFTMNMILCILGINSKYLIYYKLNGTISKNTLKNKFLCSCIIKKSYPPLFQGRLRWPKEECHYASNETQFIVVISYRREAPQSICIFLNRTIYSIGFIHPLIIIACRSPIFIACCSSLYWIDFFLLSLHIPLFCWLLCNRTYTRLRPIIAHGILARPWYDVVFSHLNIIFIISVCN